MRRLLQHSLIAAGISSLTAGAVVGSLSGGSMPAESMSVAAPVVASAAPASGSGRIAAEALERRAARASRAAQRAALTANTAAAVREKTLRTQHLAAARQEQALEKREAAAKRAAEAKRQAERKRQAEAKRQAERTKERVAQEQRRAAARATKKRSYSGNPRSIARQMMRSRYGWGASQFGCYNNIILRESGWNVHADNPSSSAYGIPQALPGSKMASAGPDWRNSPATQIAWGLGYVKSRYGTPCGAWGFKSSHGWY